MKPSALHIAVKNGSYEIVEDLLKITDVNITDGYGRTPIHYASAKGFTKIAELLIKNGADVNVKDDRGITPLHLATKNGHLEVVQLLVRNGADVNAKDDYGRTPLHYSSWFAVS